MVELKFLEEVMISNRTHTIWVVTKSEHPHINKYNFITDYNPDTTIDNIVKYISERPNEPFDFIWDIPNEIKFRNSEIFQHLASLYRDIIIKDII